MLLNRLETALMNNPVRAFLQRYVEAPRLLRLGGSLAGAHVLEVGCGRGIGAELILEYFGAARVDAFDLDPRMVAKAQARLRRYGPRVRLWTGDATRIPAPDRTYDAVVDFAIIHHVPDWRAALAEIARVLRPGGRLYAEEVLRAFIVNPAMRLLFAHPQQDRFDQRQFVEALQLQGFSAVATRGVARSFAWFVGEREAA